MRWLISLAVTAGLLLAGDAAVRSYAESTVAASLERELGRDSSAEVSLGGFPFVVRLVTGRLPAAELHATDVKRAGLWIERVTVKTQEISGSLFGDGQVQVEGGRGIAVVGVETLSRFIEQRSRLDSVTITEDGITVRIPGVGRSFRVSFNLEGGRIVIPLPRIDDVAVQLPRLLKGVGYEAIRITKDGAELSFRLHSIELPSS